jgi:hypothetical protein
MEMRIVAWDWGAINQIADNAFITIGIGVLIVRQFIWRSAQLHRMLRLPVLIIVAGFILLITELWGGFDWLPADWFIVAELGLVAVTGTAMGYVTQFRTVESGLQYRLTGIGLALWGVFIVIRIGFFALASIFGANLLAATGLILLSFGVNRVAAITIIRRRARDLINEDATTLASKEIA